MDAALALKWWKEEMEKEAAACGRTPGSVRLIPASKTVAPERLREFVDAGWRVFGENRIQEAKAKVPLLSSQVEWHFIGGLQGNKVKDAVALFACIHSVDSENLLREIEKRAAVPGKIQRVLIEVNVAGEASKHGCPPDLAPELVRLADALPHVEVAGLMTVAPFSEDLEVVRPFFRRLRELRDEIQQATGAVLPELSMGMTHDWRVAVQEGSTMIRIGTGLFGMRAP
ncbi:MAG: YggS family pyridoxal phosphate-dependent enzyme [Candidatus Methylacidiphilales bacterium]|nr:YggS family pyridoxal phosphate-dependent enzyme [Candidatus Methylacidiphilales bacterium]